MLVPSFPFLFFSEEHNGLKDLVSFYDFPQCGFWISFFFSIVCEWKVWYYYYHYYFYLNKVRLSNFYSYTSNGYMFHLFGLLFNMIAFATVLWNLFLLHSFPFTKVSYLWGSTLAFENDAVRSKRDSLLILLLNFLCTIIAITFLGQFLIIWCICH